MCSQYVVHQPHYSVHQKHEHHGPTYMRCSHAARVLHLTQHSCCRHVQAALKCCSRIVNPRAVRDDCGALVYGERPRTVLLPGRVAGDSPWCRIHCATELLQHQKHSAVRVRVACQCVGDYCSTANVGVAIDEG